MALLYEANPPHLGYGMETTLDAFMGRLQNMARVCDGVHITENVLGINRVSPILVGRLLRNMIPDVTMSLTVRVSDKTSAEIDAFMHDASDTGFSGMLAVAGDPAPGSTPSGQFPSTVVRRITQENLDLGLDMYLSIPADPDYSTMTRKIAARPKGFITQVVQSPDQVARIVQHLPGFDILPIVLYPSFKNWKAAKFLHIDMAAYSTEFDEFVRTIHRTAGNVLVTSPGDYSGLFEFFPRFNS